MNTFICPLCHRDATLQVVHDRDWVNIGCFNPNCLNPHTGWSTMLMAVSKWEQFGGQKCYDKYEQNTPENSGSK